jgi:hypothetical protein
MAIYFGTQSIIDSSDFTVEHPDYMVSAADWAIIRDAMQGESIIKHKGEKYLPRPTGMTGDYADAYEPYKERAHYPQIATYALSGALGVIVTKLPEFNVPRQLKYLVEEATKDGISLQQLFLDMIIEILQTGKCPLLVDIVPETNQFKFVRYNAESHINWKESTVQSKKSMILSVLKERLPSTNDIFSHDYEETYRVLYLDERGYYSSRLYESSGELLHFRRTPKYLGRPIDEIPLYIAGSINNSPDKQPIPLLSVANCAIKIYRKEADLANSEYLSCNPTLCIVGASNDDDLPNVVGSSVMIVLPDPQARIFYTVTDTAALTHIKAHISDLYEEAIRHGVAILDTRKGVEAAEALRIRQATQSASIYSIYLSALTAIKSGLYTMCKWGGFNKEDVKIDAPSSLTYGIPDSNIIREVVDGLGKNAIPISVVHRYLVGSGLLDQTVNLEEYIKMLVEQKKLLQDVSIVDPDKPLDQQVKGGSDPVVPDSNVNLDTGSASSGE